MASKLEMSGDVSDGLASEALILLSSFSSLSLSLRKIFGMFDTGHSNSSDILSG